MSHSSWKQVDHYDESCRSVEQGASCEPHDEDPEEEDVEEGRDESAYISNNGWHGQVLKQDAFQVEEPDEAACDDDPSDEPMPVQSSLEHKSGTDDGDGQEKNKMHDQSNASGDGKEAYM